VAIGHGCRDLLIYCGSTRFLIEALGRAASERRADNQSQRREVEDEAHGDWF
jgi:hypothetical protein